MIILGTNSIKDTGYNVANSLRFNSGSSDYLTKSVSSTSNRRTFTYSTWVKRSNLSGSNYPRIFNPFVDSNNFFDVYFRNTDALNIYSYSGGSENIDLVTTQLFRDVAWYHIVLAVDTTQGTDSNRVKLYVNGSQVTSFSANTYPSQNADLQINVSGVTNVIGRNQSGTNNYFDGYMTEIILVDGSQLAPDQFGEFDEDSSIWKPINVSGLTFGTNGFYLDFEDSSALGNDVSGNDNDFTVNNLTSIDQSVDTCTNNSCVINSLDNFYCAGTLSDGNLTIVTGASQYAPITGSIGVNSNKWYWEMKLVTGTGVDCMIGVSSAYTTATTQQLGNKATDYGYYVTGVVFNNNSSSSYGNSYTNGDIIGVALDLDHNKLYFSKNGTFQNSGDPTSGSTGTGAISITDPASTPKGFYFPAVSDYYSGTTTFSANFGSPPYAISSGNTDGNGYGNFEYAVPSGYYSLNTKNLAEYG